MYEKEILHDDYDDGTIVENVELLTNEVVGHKIVKVEKTELPEGAKSLEGYEMYGEAFAITLDTGKVVYLQNKGDCCAFTELQTFLLHADKIDHIITGVGTTGEYTTWHIYADMRDVLELKVGWSCGNPFYYAYGFYIIVIDAKQVPND